MYIRSALMAVFLSYTLASAPVAARNKCENRKYKSSNERIELILDYFCRNTDDGDPVELSGKGAEFTIHVKKVALGGGDEYLLTITRKDKRKEEEFIESEPDGELQGGAMFVFLSEMYKVKWKGKKQEEFYFDKPEKNDGEKPRSYNKRVKKFESDTRWGRKQYAKALSELEIIIKSKKKED